MTLKNTPSAISSPESADGVTHSGLPDGPMTDLFGQAVAPASLSVPQVDKAEAMTKGISGLSGFGSSASVALTESLANRLRERLGSGGSIEFSQTWKMKVTPAGRRYWAHTASGHRTSDSGYGGWPTPCQQDGPKGGPGQGTDRLPGAAAIAGYPTPCSSDNRDRGGWGDPAIQRRMKIGKSVELSMLAEAIGKTPEQSHAQTGKPGGLNPALSRWLMGYPPEWDDCAVMVTLSSRKPRRNS